MRATGTRNTRDMKDIAIEAATSSRVSSTFSKFLPFLKKLEQPGSNIDKKVKEPLTWCKHGYVANLNQLVDFVSCKV